MSVQTSTPRAAWLTPTQVPVAQRPTYTLKRLLDKTAVLLSLPLALPVMAATAIAVKRSGPGPVLFKQERIGLNAEPFTVYKFRTMHADAEQRLADVLAANGQDVKPFYKLADDPRITRIGAILRTTSLDELPQLFNVLNGSMSLVGPRPQIAAEVACYDDTARRRLDVLPGITGAWQVSGRSSLDAVDGLAIDVAYVEGWNLTGDLLILLRTVIAVLTRRGAC